MTEAVSVRVALYARVSSEKQEREDTIASQVAQLQEAAAKAGHAIVDVYKDDGVMGEILARPGLDQLRDDAQRKLFDRVLIHSPDRLARKFVYQEIVIDELRRHGVEIEFLNRKIADNPEDRLLLGVQGLFAEYEKEKIKERVRRGKLHKARKGLIVGCRPAFGYSYAKGSGRYEVDPDTAPVVRMIFDWIVNNGFSLGDVCRELTARGIARPTSFGSRSGWGRSSVSKIVNNDIYAGLYFYNRRRSVEPAKTQKRHQKALRTARKFRPEAEWIPVAVPPLVEKGAMEAVRARLESNRVMKNGQKARPYLLRGLIRCGECRTRMQGDPGKGRWPNYRCANRTMVFPAPRTCQASTIRAEKVEPKVWGAIRRVLENPSILLSKHQDLQAAHAGRRQVSESEAEQVMQERARLKREEARLIEAYTAGALSMEQMRPQMERIRERSRAVEERTAAASTVPAALDMSDFEEVRKAILRGLEAAEADPAKKQEILRLLVESVVVEPGQLRITGAIPTGSVHSVNTVWTVPGVQAFRFELIENLAA